jgi:hypothetical protein
MCVDVEGLRHTWVFRKTLQANRQHINKGLGKRRARFNEEHTRLRYLGKLVQDEWILASGIIMDERNQQENNAVYPTTRKLKARENEGQRLSMQSRLASASPDGFSLRMAEVRSLHQTRYYVLVRATLYALPTHMRAEPHLSPNHSPRDFLVSTSSIGSSIGDSGLG